MPDQTHENLLARIKEAKGLLQQLRQRSGYSLEQRQEHDDLEDAIEEVERFVVMGQLDRQTTNGFIAEIKADIAILQEWLSEPPAPLN